MLNWVSFSNGIPFIGAKFSVFKSFEFMFFTNGGIPFMTPERHIVFEFSAMGLGAISSKNCL